MIHDDDTRKKANAVFEGTNKSRKSFAACVCFFFKIYCPVRRLYAFTLEPVGISFASPSKDNTILMSLVGKDNSISKRSSTTN